MVYVFSQGGLPFMNCQSEYYLKYIAPGEKKTSNTGKNPKKNGSGYLIAIFCVFCYFFLVFSQRQASRNTAPSVPKELREEMNRYIMDTYPLGTPAGSEGTQEAGETEEVYDRDDLSAAVQSALTLQADRQEHGKAYVHLDDGLQYVYYCNEDGNGNSAIYMELWTEESGQEKSEWVDGIVISMINNPSVYIILPEDARDRIRGIYYYRETDGEDQITSKEIISSEEADDWLHEKVLLNP